MASIKDEGTVLEKVDKDVQMAGTTELGKTAEGKLRYKSFKYVSSAILVPVFQAHITFLISQSIGPNPHPRTLEHN